jgi:two-component system chemotaxis response regulator CheY
MAAPKPFTVEPLVRTVGRDIFPAETRFLVVDDVDSMRSIVRAMIRDLGYYSIMEAHDATKAISVMQTAHELGRPIDVVLSDWEMPGMSGLEFLETLRASETYSNVTFIMITGVGQRESIEAALRQGVSGYLVKLFNQDQLEAQLRAAYIKTRRRPSDSAAP